MDVSSKTTGDSLTGAEFTQLVTEIENAIEDTGITLSSGTLDQLSKSISNYAAGGQFYVDSGAADAYVLSPVGNKLGITSYQNGQRLMFLVGATNTGASTVNVNSIGAKAIVDINGNALTGGELVLNDIVELVYISASNHFKLINSKFSRSERQVDVTKSVDYTITDSDQVRTVYVNAIDKTITLPTAADNDGREITIVKNISSSGFTRIDGEGAEVIKYKGGSFTTFDLDFFMESITLKCDGTAWWVTNHTGNGVEYDLSLTGASSTDNDYGMVYKSYKGNVVNFMLNFSIAWTEAAASTSGSVSIDNVVSANLGSYHAISGGNDGSVAMSAKMTANTGNIACTGDGSNATWFAAGTIQLESKPNFVV